MSSPTAPDPETPTEAPDVPLEAPPEGTSTPTFDRPEGGFAVTPDDEPTPPAEAGAPSVVVVAVSEGSEERLARLLRSIEAQDYPNLDVLVIDAAGRSLDAAAVAGHAAEAYLHQPADAQPFSAAANEVLGIVEGATFLLFCRDDVELDAHCVTALVEEVYRSNAAAVVPKLLRADDPRRLAGVGQSVDRLGALVDLVESGEFDQEQYDNVRDVFVAPAGVQLVRADLFRALGGFDNEIVGPGADLDLSWRIQVAGGRVLVVPAARARIDTERVDRTVDEERALVARNRLRTLAVTASTPSLFLTLLPALLLTLVEALYSLVAARPQQARGAVAAIAWNAARIPDIRKRRARLQELRRLDDGDVRALQVGGSARIGRFFDERRAAGADRVVDWLRELQSSFSGRTGGELRDAFLIMTMGLLLVVFGSRHLITRGVVPVGEFPVLESGGSWWPSG